MIWPWGKEEGGVYRERWKEKVEEVWRTKIGLSEKWDKKEEKGISTKEKGGTLEKGTSTKEK